MKISIDLVVENFPVPDCVAVTDQSGMTIDEIHVESLSEDSLYKLCNRLVMDIYKNAGKEKHDITLTVTIPRDSPKPDSEEKPRIYSRRQK